MAYCKICGVMISLRWGARPICPDCLAAEKAAAESVDGCIDPPVEPDGAE